MKLIFGQQSPSFYLEPEAFPGVHRVCGMVRKDVQRVTGYYPTMAASACEATDMVIIGTVGRSPLLERLASEGRIHLSQIRGKWETYLFQLVSRPLPGVKRALIIAGSDKRGIRGREGR